MSHTRWLLYGVAFSVLLLACGAAQDAAAGSGAPMTGSFTRGKGGKQTNLDAVFTPKANQEQQVVFTCKWSGKDCTFNGTAKGNPFDGKLSGQATMSGSKRTWKFEGETKNGELRCQHWELKGGKEEFTGEFVLKKKL